MQYVEDFAIVIVSAHLIEQGIGLGIIRTSLQADGVDIFTVTGMKVGLFKD